MTPPHVLAVFQRQADELSARVRNLMDASPQGRKLAEGTARMITDQHGHVPGLGRALISAACAVSVSGTFLEDRAGAEMGSAGTLNLLAAVGQVLAEQEAP